jgi:hypothetical protein
MKLRLLANRETAGDTENKGCLDKIGPDFREGFKTNIIF